MLRAFTLTVLGLAAAAAAATTVFAQTTIDATNPSAVLDVASGWGSATLEKDTSGRPKIRGRAKGHAYVIWFAGCTDGQNCRLMKLWAGYKKPGVTLTTINEWNRTKRFGKAYLTKQGTSIVEIWMNMDEGGILRSNLDDTFSIWVNAIMGMFQEHIGWEG